jgi:peptide/nickel transport system permease protein
MAMIPGDPATAILGSYATPENVAGSTGARPRPPAVEQYFIWLGNLLQGDFGRSYASTGRCIDEVLERFSAPR